MPASMNNLPVEIIVKVIIQSLQFVSIKMLIHMFIFTPSRS